MSQDSSAWDTSPTARWPPLFIWSSSLRKPLLIEGHAGLGKTEVAKVLASLLGTRLIRLQCYEGLDVSSAVYEWNYQKQLLAIKIAGGIRADGRRKGTAHLQPGVSPGAAVAAVHSGGGRCRRCC